MTEKQMTMERKEYEENRKRKLQHEIQWLEDKLKTVKKEKHRKDLQRQIKEREYELHLAIYKTP